MLNAEELDVGSQTVVAALQSTKPDVMRLVGTEGNFGEQIGLTRDWAARVVRLVGNYAEVYERNVGIKSRLGIPRGLNQLWSGGGIMYAPEFGDAAMADYYDILRKAVDGLERNDAQARLALYERARQTVLTRQPLLPQDEVDRHLEGVRDAARRIEAEFADAPTLRPAMHSQPVARDTPPAEAGAMPARRIGLVTVGVLGAILAAGLSAYYLAARGPDTPQASRTERTTPAPAPARREQAKREAEATPDQASYVLRQQRVYYRTTHPVGSIVVARNQRFLLHGPPNNVAIRYAIGVGRKSKTSPACSA